MRTLAIALNTFREARRDRVQWILLAYAAVVLGAALVLSPLALGEGYRITRDIGLAAISAVGVILIVLVGAGMVQKEVDRRTVLTVLAKPVRRSEFLVGKFLGMMAMVGAIFLAMTAILCLAVWMREGRLEPAVVWAAAFTLGELTVMTAVVVTFSTFVSPALSGIFTLAIFVFGHFTEDLLRFAEKTSSSALAAAAQAFYHLLPHLQLFNLRAEAAYGIVPDAGRLAAASAYTLLYTAALLCVGSVVFSRREFK